jgi:hypothetical protein
MNRKQLPISGEFLIDQRPLGEPMSFVRLRRRARLHPDGRHYVVTCLSGARRRHGSSV